MRGGGLTELQVQVIRNDRDPDRNGNNLAKGPAGGVDELEGKVVVIEQTLVDGAEEVHARSNVEAEGRRPGVSEQIADIGE